MEEKIIEVFGSIGLQAWQSQPYAGCGVTGGGIVSTVISLAVTNNMYTCMDLHRPISSQSRVLYLQPNEVAMILRAIAHSRLK